MWQTEQCFSLLGSASISRIETGMLRNLEIPAVPRDFEKGCVATQCCR